MSTTPESKAREIIDDRLTKAWRVIQNVSDINIMASLGVAVREFPIPGQWFADYLLYIDGRAIGVIEAKKEWETLTGVEIQSAKYRTNFPDRVDCWRLPLPFSYQSTGAETRFTNHLEDTPRSREVFAFHQPKTLLDRIQQDKQASQLLQEMPKLITAWLRPAQIEAIHSLETSLAQNRPRALIQMATWSGKTFTACNFMYRLIKFWWAKRILFLVDRWNLWRQTLKELKNFTTPDDGRKFTDIYNAQLLKSNVIDDVAKVSISTVQRMYSMLSGHEIDADLEEQSLLGKDQSNPLQEPEPVTYNPMIPIESYDYIVIDECHRSIYNLWRQVLDYFDAKLIGLTATPSKQTIWFFDNNLVMEYNHEKAVVDGVNCDYGVYKIVTQISQAWSKVESWYYIDKRDKLTRRKRQELLDEDLVYDAKKLDRSVVVPDQIRTVIKEFKNKLFTHIFPWRTEVPKTLIFAKTDAHADDIVQMVREEFNVWNEFCIKITYKTTGKKTEDLIQDFRNTYMPRIAVTVDMIATGTDIKPLECVFFMRDVGSELLFEQMKGRWCRVINDDDYQQVVSDNDSKTHFVIVDAVWVTERDRSDMKPLDKKPSVWFEKILKSVALWNTDPDLISTLVSRIARASKSFGPQQTQKLEEIAGKPLQALLWDIMHAIDNDTIHTSCQQTYDLPPWVEPSDEQWNTVRKILVKAQLTPLYDPKFREALMDAKRDSEQTIDTVSIDAVLESWYSSEAKIASVSIIDTFAEFLEENKEELLLIQKYYSKSYQNKISYEELKEFEKALASKQLLNNQSRLREALDIMYPWQVLMPDEFATTDYISLIEFVSDPIDTLQSYRVSIEENYESWLGKQAATWHIYTPNQQQRLGLMKDQVGTSLSLTNNDFEYGALAQAGWLGLAYSVFGEKLQGVIGEMNEVLVR